MIEDYSNRRPQSFIYQQRDIIEDTNIVRNNAFIFGPAKYVSSVEADNSNITKLTITSAITDDVWSNLNFVLDKGKLPSSAEIDTATDLYKDGNKYYIIANNNFYNSDNWDNATDAKLHIVKINTNGEEEDEEHDLTNSNGIAAVATIAAPDADANAEVYVTFKAVKKFSASEPIKHIRSNSDIIKHFGPIVKDNPLGMACMFALLGSEGKSIMADATNSSAVSSDFETVLNKAMNTDRVQFLAPIGYASDKAQAIAKACQSHVVAMSTEKRKRWRRCYFGSQYQTTSDSDKDNIKSEVITQSRSFSSDRMINVWCDGAKYLTDNGEEALDNYYIAAIIAGMRSVMPVQQGMSKQVVPVISNIDKMYTVWDEDSLDDIAAHGTFIITQDYSEQEIYIRHQLTTQTSKGIMYWEDSVGVNYDDICYATKDVVAPYEGKRNGTEDTLIEMENRFSDMLYAKNSNIEDRKIGPQIKGIKEGSIKVYIDPNMLDRVVMKATLILPLPINTIVVEYFATASI